MSDYKHPLYMTWYQMNYRCNNPKSPGYQLYGGKGICVCDRWSSKNQKGFKHFIIDMGMKPSKNFSLDRIDNRFGYSKENCRWASKYSQRENQEYDKADLTLNGYDIDEPFRVNFRREYKLDPYQEIRLARLIERDFNG